MASPSRQEGVLSNVLNSAGAAISNAWGRFGPPRPPPRPNDTIKDINSAIYQRKRHLEGVKRTLEGLKASNARLDQQHKSLVAMRDESQRQLHSVTQDLQAVQLLSPTEGSLTEHDLVPQFHALEQVISNLATEIALSLHLPSNPHTIEAVLKGSDDGAWGEMKAFLRFAHQYYGEKSSRDILLVISHFSLRFSIWEDIFVPFSPGIQPKKDAELKRTYHSVCARENQDRSGCWRAMTNTYIKIPSIHQDELAHNTLKKLAKVFGILHSLKVSEPDLLLHFHEKTKVLIDQALKFKNMVQMQCTGTNVEVARTTTHDKFIGIDGGTGNPTKAIIPIGLGLISVEFKVDEKGGFIRRERCLSFVRYIGNDWNPSN